MEHHSRLTREKRVGQKCFFSLKKIEMQTINCVFFFLFFEWQVGWEFKSFVCGSYNAS